MSLIQKIAKTSLALGPLGKNDRNPHHKYAYVSIDSYYEAVPTLAAENGVFWTTTEEDVSDTPSGEIRTKYRFDVYDLESDKAEDRLTIMISVTHPFQGAQTSGASFSYAEKVFMRSLFKIVSGEPDSDGLDAPQERGRKTVGQRDQESTPASRPALKKLEPQSASVETEAATLYGELSDKFSKMVTVEDLANVLVQERKNINKLKSLDEKLHKKLQGFYAECIVKMEVKEGKRNG